MSDIADLFRIDPLKLTREQTIQIVSYYRDRRKQFLLQQLSGPTKKVALTAKEKETSKLKLAIDL